MCHDWWERRRWEEREASRELWNEFSQTRPVSDPEVTEEKPVVTLEERQEASASAER